ncbi:MAG: hypothetical protein IT349_16315 [Candidatus Eisenbacteria bacterium]|nr:hypothetical protein [Candidatus Eisenbacteria bacterium]
MRLLTALIVVPLLATAWVGSSAAGPNADGVLVLHAVPYQDRDDTPPACEGFDLTSCSDAVVDLPLGGSSSRWHWFVFGAFPDGSSPRVKGVTFGVQYDIGVFLLGWSGCGDFELPGAGWPETPGTGTSITWDTARTDQVLQVYGFYGYSYYAEPAQFCLIPNPDQGGYFGDDSIPSILDPIADYGCLGFGTPGYAPCPTVEPEVGACCLADGTCLLLSESDCLAQGGNWLGPDSDSCDPNPCAVPTDRTSWGVVKERFAPR